MWLNSWKRKILKCIYGPVIENERWIIRTNNKLRMLYKDIDVVPNMRERKLQWLSENAGKERRGLILLQ